MSPTKLGREMKNIAPNYSNEDPALLRQMHHMMMGLRDATLLKTRMGERAPPCNSILSKVTSLLGLDVTNRCGTKGVGSNPWPSLPPTHKPVTYAEPVKVNCNDFNLSLKLPSTSLVRRTSGALEARSTLVRRGDLKGGLIAGTIPVAICIAILFIVMLRHFIRRCIRRCRTRNDNDVEPQPTNSETVDKPDPPDLHIVTDQNEVYYERGDSPTTTALKGFTPTYERYSMRHNFDPPTVNTTPLPDSPMSLTVPSTSRPFRPLPQIPTQVQPPKSPVIPRASPVRTSPQTPRFSIHLPEDALQENHPPTSFRDLGMRHSFGTLSPCSRTSLSPSFVSQSSNKTIQGIKKIIRFSNSTYNNEPALSDAASHTLGNLSRQTSSSSTMSRKRRASIASSLGTESDIGTFSSWYRVPHDAPALPALAFLKEDVQGPGSPLKTLME